MVERGQLNGRVGIDRKKRTYVEECNHVTEFRQSGWHPPVRGRKKFSSKEHEENRNEVRDKVSDRRQLEEGEEDCRRSEVNDAEDRRNGYLKKQGVHRDAERMADTFEAVAKGIRQYAK